MWRLPSVILADLSIVLYTACPESWQNIKQSVVEPTTVWLHVRLYSIYITFREDIIQPYRLIYSAFSRCHHVCGLGHSNCSGSVAAAGNDDGAHFDVRQLCDVEVWSLQYIDIYIYIYHLHWQPDMLNVPVGSATISSLDSGFVSQDASSLYTAYHDPRLLQLTDATVSSAVFKNQNSYRVLTICKEITCKWQFVNYSLV